MPHSDEWIEDRIRFQAGKHSLPLGRTLFFADADLDTQRAVTRHLAESHGSPVLLGFSR
jgi:hypothetical protein